MARSRKRDELEIAEEFIENAAQRFRAVRYSEEMLSRESSAGEAQSAYLLKNRSLVAQPCR